MSTSDRFDSEIGEIRAWLCFPLPLPLILSALQWLLEKMKKNPQFRILVFQRIKRLWDFNNADSQINKLNYMRKFCIQQPVDSQKADAHSRGLEIKGRDTASTKADDEDFALSIELPTRKLRRRVASAQEVRLRRLIGKHTADPRVDFREANLQPCAANWTLNESFPSWKSIKSRADKEPKW